MDLLCLQHRLQTPLNSRPADRLYRSRLQRPGIPCGACLLVVNQQDCFTQQLLGLYCIVLDSVSLLAELCVYGCSGSGLGS